MKNMLTTAAFLALALSPLAHAVESASGARGASAPRATGTTSPTGGTSAMSPVNETASTRPASGARGASAPRATGATSPTAGTSAMNPVNETASTRPAASAAGTASKPSSQQSRMKDCNEKAAGMKGDERRAMMKECLSNKSADAKAGAGAADAKDAKGAKDSKQAQGKDSQQNRMKACSAEAKGKSGDERRSFMKECLSNKPA